MSYTPVTLRAAGTVLVSWLSSTDAASGFVRLVFTPGIVHHKRMFSRMQSVAHYEIMANFFAMHLSIRRIVTAALGVTGV